MFNKLGFKIFYIILTILTFILLSILVFIIYIIPNIYHSYSIENSEQYLNDIAYCLENDIYCQEEFQILDEYFFYATSNNTEEIYIIESTSSGVVTHSGTYDGVIPNYEYITQEITIDNVNYTLYLEVKNIDTSFFKKFIIPLFFLVIIISSIVSFFVSRLFTKPIKIINKQINELEELNFNNTIHVNQKDELGEISNSLTKLNDVISLGISSIETKQKNSEDFLKIMSHELKTPLTVVRGYNELLTLDTNLTKVQTNYLNISINEIDNMTQLINNSIISSKLDTFNDNIHKKVINLDELIYAEIQTYSKIYPHVKVNMNLNKYEYKTNPDIIKLAIKNIIENAFLHHVENTEIQITLKDNYFEVQNITPKYFDTTKIEDKNNKNLGVYIIVTALQLLNLKYQFTIIDNQVSFKILL